MSRHRHRVFWSSLSVRERRTLATMTSAVVGLHVLGFATLLAFAGKAGVPTIGIGLTAYTLGLRHAFDADHISAIDNSTRRLMAEGKRPLSVGFWFSLGHSTVVFALALLISLGVRSLTKPAMDSHSMLRGATSSIGMAVSGGFLYLIAAINMVILIGIVNVFREMRRGCYDEAKLDRQLDSRGLMNRLFGRVGRAVTKPQHMYPIGLLFGLGFDTASEVALLVIAVGAGSTGSPWYTILSLPLLFAAGMSLMDSIDGSFMNFAYGWALSKPVRKIFYNIAITSLSVAVALLIGTIEVGGLISAQLDLSGPFWTWLGSVDVNALGLVIVAMFVATWAIALVVWRLGRIEERWSARLQPERARALVEARQTASSSLGHQSH